MSVRECINDGGWAGRGSVYVNGNEQHAVILRVDEKSEGHFLVVSLNDTEHETAVLSEKETIERMATKYQGETLSVFLSRTVEV